MGSFLAEIQMVLTKEQVAALLALHATLTANRPVVRPPRWVAGGRAARAAAYRCLGRSAP
jgi:hypothetical protein